MRSPIFYGKVVDHKVALDNVARWRAYLASMEGKRIELVLREKRDVRSGEQNKYYHAVVVGMISEYTGHTPEETHEILKKHFRIESTARLKTQEFEALMDRIRSWAGDMFGINIPLPNQVDY